MLGYHHEWSPGVHTLLLASRLDDEFSVFNPAQATYFLIKPPGGDTVYAEQIQVEEHYRSTQEIYATELQQIWEQPRHHTVIGGRYQLGEFHTRNLQTNPVVLGEIIGYFDPSVPLADQDVRSDFHRWSVYAYHNWQILPALQIAGGLAYDWIKFPDNFRQAPVSDKEQRTDRISPKGGFVWTPAENSVVRFAYTRSLAGASIDQTYLLEPSQVAGFNQSFRSIIPESVGGAEAGARFETFGLALEQKFGSGTYVGVSGQILDSQVRPTLGTFEFTGASVFAQPSGTPDAFDYTERSVLVSVNQLLGKEWSFGASYRLTQADLRDDFTDVPDSAFTLGFLPRQNLTAILHQVTLETFYNHRSGFFADFQAVWYGQSNHGYSPALPGDDFWQLNLLAGYRFPGRHVALRAGVLNLTDRDYRLNPLTLYNELPRARTFAARLQFNF